LLSHCGADQVWLHTGYNESHQWNNIYDYPMEKTAWGWAKSFKVAENAGQLHLCFKDSANNWDNNNGWDWSYDVRHK